MAGETDSGEKTEEATPRRREEAREKGQVAMSTEFISGVALAVAFGLYLLMSGPILERLGSSVRNAFGALPHLSTLELDEPSASAINAPRHDQRDHC